MGSPQHSASMLLASLIILCWMGSSAWSHGPSDPSALYRGKRDLPFEAREKTQNLLETAKESVTLLNEIMTKKGKDNLSSIMKGLSNFASVAPGLGMVFAIINTVLIFNPQTDPVFDAVKEGFAEVDRKLDSLTFQISNLAADVEWFNYASVYSQDELRILGAWRKYNDFFNKRGSNDINYLAKVFTNYYEYTQVEASVANFYHYLTVSDTSLSGNLNNLLRKKLKCDVRKIGQYNLYFTSLLWKGIVLNEAYWKLIGFDSSGKQTDHAKMFKDVFEAQLAMMKACMSNITEYVENDVKEITAKVPSLSEKKHKQDLADRVKAALDDKYNWYNWVVLVYEKSQEESKNILPLSMTKIPRDKIVVAIDYILKADIPATTEYYISEAVRTCHVSLQGCAPCLSSSTPICIQGDCRNEVILAKSVKATHATFNDEYVVAPAPDYKKKCRAESSEYTFSVYKSKELPVCDNICQNNGKCTRLLNSNEVICECPDGYYGDKCEKQIDTKLAQEMVTLFPLPTVLTTSVRLGHIESKLDDLLKRCPE